MKTEHFLSNEQATLTFAAGFAKNCKAHCVIFLYGNLGAGKTTFVRGFLRGLGYEGKVKSPTYTLVEPYAIDQKKIFHFDLYRLNDPEELIFIGAEDYFAEQAIFLIEWPERGADLLPQPTYRLYFEIQDPGRKLRISM